MKIIFSPSKSQSIIKSVDYNMTEVLFPQKTQFLFEILQKLTRQELQKLFKLSDSLTEQVFEYYHNSQAEISAIELFSGTSFVQMDSWYDKKYQEYMQSHIVILSALHGLLRPFDAICPYRLDLSDNILLHDDRHKNLYHYWQKKISEYFNNEDTVLNLASLEYKKMLPIELQDCIINIHFMNEIKGIQKTSSVESKKQRGKLLHYCILNNTTDILLLKKYSCDGFTFDSRKSTKHNYYYICKK